MYLSQFWIVIYRPVFYLKLDVSETELRLRFKVEPTQLGPIDRAIYWVQISMFPSKKETEHSLWNVVF
jgi:hypothetical protein